MFNFFVCWSLCANAGRSALTFGVRVIGFGLGFGLGVSVRFRIRVRASVRPRIRPGYYRVRVRVM